MNLNPIAVDDAFSLDFDNIISGNFVANDDPTDGPGFFLLRVNDDPISLFTTTTFTLPSGAEINVTPTGGFIYRPNGAFDDDTRFGPSAGDTFSYTVSDGVAESTANVNFTINRVVGGLVEVTGTDDSEPVVGGEISELVSGLGGDDTINAGGGDDTVSCGSGNDIANGGAGNDLMLGGGLQVDAIDAVYRSAENTFPDAMQVTVLFVTGDTSFSVTEDFGNDIQDGGVGNDTIVDLGGANDLKGGAGSDQIVDGDGDSTLSGGEGDDGIVAGGGADFVMAGAGNDFGAGGKGDDLVTAESGTNVLDGGEGDDTVMGGIGNDLVIGGLGDDSVFGGSGDDVLNGGGGFTNPGFDNANGENAGYIQGLLEQSAFSFGELERLGLITTPTLEPFADFATFAVPERLSGLLELGNQTPGQDSLFGGDGNDFLNGGSGSDLLFGGTGNDFLTSAGGGDMLDGGSGSDSLFGGAGGDMLLGRGGKDSVLGGGGRDEIVGGGGADFLDGQGGRDNVQGGGGKDAVNGGGGKDDLDGQGGADNLDGGGGRDVVNGGRGRDLVSGGRGRDELTGGVGADVFEFTTGDGRDSITDFEQGRDKIQITNGAAEFSDLLVRQVGGDVLIGFSNVRVLVEDQNVADFGANDFIFGG